MKHRNHLYICLAMVGAAGLAYAFVPAVQNLGWTGLIILVCPLMHVFMGHGEQQSKHPQGNKHHH